MPRSGSELGSGAVSTETPWRLPSLDGWRAVSILIVLGSHSIFATGFPLKLKPVFHWIFDGNLGVRFFFVISGFLITRLLLQEWNLTGFVDLRNFYIRRCLRILPVYCAYLLFVFVVLRFWGITQSGLSWLGCLTFTRNTFGTDPVSAHLWSLSVEEQFYFLWPVTLLFICRRKNVQALLAVAVFSILLAPMLRGAMAVLPFPDFPTAHLPDSLISRVFFFFCVIVGRFLAVFDSLFFGCLASILLIYKSGALKAVLMSRPLGTATLGAVMIVLPHLVTRLVETPSILFVQFGNSLQALGFSVLLLQSVLMPAWGVYRALNWRWICRIGILSYSLYIWQQLVLAGPNVAGMNHLWWMGLWLVPLFLVASVSYYAIERPLLRLRNAYRQKPLARFQAAGSHPAAESVNV